MRGLFSFLAAFAISVCAIAAEPDEVLADPALEARAKEIDVQLRCVVCQSQSIADSNAPLAKDMRVIVRERLLAGDTDQEAIQFLVDRYGDYVLLKPPIQGNTVFLWLFPALAVAASVAIAVAYLREGKTKPPKAARALTEEDDATIQRIIDEHSK